MLFQYACMYCSVAAAVCSSSSSSAPGPLFYCSLIAQLEVADQREMIRGILNAGRTIFTNLLAGRKF